MIKNNIKCLFWHLLWYGLLMSVYFMPNVKALLNILLQDQTVQMGALALMTVVYTMFVEGLFITPTGENLTDFTSNTTLALLDLGLLAIAFLGWSLKIIQVYQLGIVLVMIALQWAGVFLVLSIKYKGIVKRLESEYEETVLLNR